MIGTWNSFADVNAQFLDDHFLKKHSSDIALDDYAGFIAFTHQVTLSLSLKFSSRFQLPRPCCMLDVSSVKVV